MLNLIVPETFTDIAGYCSASDHSFYIQEELNLVELAVSVHDYMCI